MANFPELLVRQSYYLEQVLDLPPLVSCAAFDALVGTANGGRLLTRPVARAGVAELFADPGSPSEWAADPLAAYRSVAGTLRLATRRMAIELELNPYSGDRTQLGLRPLRWGWTAWPSEALMSAGAELIQVLAKAMMTDALTITVAAGSELTDAA